METIMDIRRKAVRDVLLRVNEVILGKERLTLEVLAALLAGGHVLLEDMPGVGKTTLAVAFAKLLGLDWKRVQFTPDVLPSDLTGFSVYRRDLEKFVYQPGAVFCNLLLADEINRTSPKTQSALLEVMEERQVTVEGETRSLPEPFFVIATQNPAGAVGTQLLPPAQMDRFMIRTAIGYPDFESECAMARGADSTRRADALEALMDAQALRAVRREVEAVFVHDAVARYAVRLIDATRSSPYLEYGASPRGTLALVRMAKASAWLQGHGFVAPADIAEQFLPCTNHRVQRSVRAQMENMELEAILGRILEETPRPKLREKSES